MNLLIGTLFRYPFMKIMVAFKQITDVRGYCTQNRQLLDAH